MTDLHQKARHPAVLSDLHRHSTNVQLRIAETITRFAGSMVFVYTHAIGFVIWMTVFEASPWPTLTLVVSLEAIFLSTFIMIGQNRQAQFQQEKANHDYLEQVLKLKENTEITKQIHGLTCVIHDLMTKIDDQHKTDS